MAVFITNLIFFTLPVLILCESSFHQITPLYVRHLKKLEDTLIPHVIARYTKALEDQLALIREYVQDYEDHQKSLNPVEGNPLDIYRLVRRLALLTGPDLTKLSKYALDGISYFNKRRCNFDKLLFIFI